MKRLLTCLLLSVSLSCIGMQESQQANDTQPQSVRARLYNVLIEATAGRNVDPITDSDLSDELKNASPREFCNKIRADQFKALQDIFESTKGITPEMIEDLKKQIRSEEKPLISLPSASSHIQQVVAKATEHMAGPQIQVVCDNTSEHMAYVTQNRMIVNEKQLNEKNVTPRKLAVIARHEDVHKRKEDELTKEAYLRALCQKNGSTALTPQSKTLYLFLSRHTEGFADAEGSSSDINHAMEAQRMTEYMIESQQFGDGGYTHHTHAQRWQINHLMVELHESSSVAQRRRRMKRNLHDTFAATAQEQLSAQSWQDDQGHTKLKFKRTRRAIETDTSEENEAANVLLNLYKNS